MKALSIRQPWAWAICAGFKPVENRDWRTHFRGRVLVHAGMKEDQDDVDFVLRQIASQTGKNRGDLWNDYCDALSLGAIVGAVTITDCVEQMGSPWFFGRYGFVLAEAVAIEPIACKGKLGFFEVPEDVADCLRTGDRPALEAPPPAVAKTKQKDLFT